MISSAEYCGEDWLHQRPKPSALQQRRASYITNALSNIQLGSDTDSQPQPMSQDKFDQKFKELKELNIPRYLSIEVNNSQELMGTPDYATPVDQQFQVEYDPGQIKMNEESESKSPAHSPVRFSKRPRHVIGVDQDSEATSQPSQSDRSQGEPSTSSRTTSGCIGHLPPRHRGPPRRPKSPTAFRNPFTQEEGDTTSQFSTRLNTRLAYQNSRMNLDFKLGRLLGHGHFSQVFSATHRLDGQEYALKIVKPRSVSEEWRNNWLQEIQALAAVRSHPNIVQYYSAWAEQEGGPVEALVIQLELCEGSLRELLKARGGPLKEAELLTLMKQMAGALAHMHSRNVVHMDIKPDNIYTSKAGLFKLGDFGLATLKHGHYRVQEGDSRYCPQELLNANYHHLDKADIFGLGATLYELASGAEMPKGGPAYQRLRQGKLALLPHVSRQFQDLLKSLMHEDPAQRPTAEALLKSPLASRAGLSLSSARSPVPPA